MTESYSRQIAEIAKKLELLTVEERKELKEEVLTKTGLWVPLPGPQEVGYSCQADEMFFGGQAGGSKTDLIIGLALTRHRRSIIFRRESTQTVAIIDRITEILGHRKGWNGQQLIWRLPKGRQIEIGSCPNLGDEVKYSGRPHDLLSFDEAPLFNIRQVRFLSTWARTTSPGQRVRIVFTGNPPQNEEGRWIISYFGPWLDKKHPKPALPGELRWYTTIDGKDVEVSDGTPFEHNGETLTPKSRTFIPSSIDDNPFLMVTGYKSTLQALPEPLRSQMLLGDFTAGIRDSEWQVIPTEWVEMAQARWTPDGKQGKRMDSVGADCSRGGKDQFVISARHGYWYDKLKVYPGKDVPDGPTGAGLIVAAMRDEAPIHVDVVGIGSSVFDVLKGLSVQLVGINSAESAPENATDKATSKLRFRNMRSFLWWRFRESLDPVTGNNVALPPDPELKADLCAPLWQLTARGEIQIEPKEDKIGADGVKIAGIKKRLGRSPDRGEAVIYCSMQTQRRAKKEDLPPIKNIARTYVPHIFDPSKRGF